MRTKDIPRPVVSLLRQLTPSEMKEVIRFALFLKTRVSFDQAYFWTQGWQRRERAAARDKRLSRTLGDGTVDGLLALLHRS